MGWLALALALCLSMIAASCSKSSDDTTNSDTSSTVPQANSVGGMVAGPKDTTSIEGGKIKYGIDAEPEGLDPTRYAFSQAGHVVASSVFEPLATLDDKGNAIPYLAKSFESSTDFKTWTIELPTGVTFHDGTPMDVEAVLASMNAYRSSPIVSAALNATVDSFEKKDATHIVVKLKKAAARFPLLLSTQAGYIIAPAMLTNPELAKKPIGTGPFKFDTHEDGKIWSFKKFDGYRQKGLPHLDQIDFIPLIDPVDRNAQLKSSDLDVIQTYGGPQVIELRASGDAYKRVENEFGDKAFLMMNTSKPPFDNLSARRAVAYATDSASWRKEQRADVATIANSPYGPGQPGYLKDNGYPTFDIEKAKAAVADYKKATGNDLSFKFIVADDATNAAVGQTFKASFEKAGMKVELVGLPQISLLAQAATGNFELSQFRLFGQPNPDADVHFYRGSSIPKEAGISINFPRFVTPEIDAAIDDAVASTDEAQRAKDYEKINKVFAEQVPYVWLGQETWMVAANPRVNGIYAAANGSIATVGAKTWIAQLSVSS
jgi:peptide/nickel transport system substrate-binding protein